MDIQTTNNSRVVKTPDHKNPQKQLQEVMATQDQRNHSTQETDNKLKSVNHHLAKSQVQTGLVTEKFKKLFTSQRLSLCSFWGSMAPQPADDEERLTTIDSRNHLCNNGQDPAADLSYTRNRMRQDRAQEDKQRDMDIQTTNNSRVVKTPDDKNPQKQLQEVVATQDQRNHSTQETDNKLKSVNHHLAKSQVQTGLVTEKFKKLFTSQRLSLCSFWGSMAPQPADDEERLTTIDSRNHLCNNGQDPAADLSYTRNRMRQDRAQEDKQRDMDIQTTNNSRVVKTPDHKNPQKQLQEVVATQDQRNHSTQETDNKLKSVNHHLAKSQVQTGLVSDKFKKLFTSQRLSLCSFWGSMAPQPADDEERLTTIDSRNHLCNNGQDPAADLSYTRNRMRQDRAQEDKQRDMDIQTTNNSRVVKTPDHKNPQKQLQEVVATQDQRNHSTQETDNKLKSVNHHLAKSQVQTGLVTDKFKKLFTSQRLSLCSFWGSMAPQPADDEERLTTIDSRNHLCNNGQDPAADLSYTRNRMRQDRAQEDKQRDMDIQTTNNSRVVKTPDHKNPQKQLQEVVATQDQRNHSTQETDNKLKSVNHHLAKSQVQTGLVTDKFKKLFTSQRLSLCSFWGSMAPQPADSRTATETFQQEHIRDKHPSDHKRHSINAKIQSQGRRVLINLVPSHVRLIGKDIVHKVSELATKRRNIDIYISQSPSRFK
ncbi:uncharacterized protein [Procambarus clarkii]|uniref:uncharacterized protein n=1 Tax=Procambarus clarkii TaxID=6728 RepID=UPI00374380D3